MHKFDMNFVFHFYVLRSTSWIWTNPSTEELKFENPSQWNWYKGFNLECWSHSKEARTEESLTSRVWRYGERHMSIQILRATSHTRLRACDHYTSSTLIGTWKRESQSKFASHYTWGTNGAHKCKMDVKSTWIPTWHQMDHVSWSLGLFSKTTSWR